MVIIIVILVLLTIITITNNNNDKNIDNNHHHHDFQKYLSEQLNYLIGQAIVAYLISSTTLRYFTYEYYCNKTE